MSELLILILIVGIWYLLQAYILPKLGVSTWVREACQVTRDEENAEDAGAKKSN